MQTAVNWLIEQITEKTKNGTFCSINYMKEHFFEQAKEIEKQQIVNAYLKDRRQVTMDKALMLWDKAERYYNDKYVNKQSDDHIVDTNEMI